MQRHHTTAGGWHSNFALHLSPFPTTACYTVPWPMSSDILLKPFEQAMSLMDSPHTWYEHMDGHKPTCTVLSPPQRVELNGWRLVAGEYLLNCCLFLLG